MRTRASRQNRSASSIASSLPCFASICARTHAAVIANSSAPMSTRAEEHHLPPLELRPEAHHRVEERAAEVARVPLGAAQMLAERAELAVRRRHLRRLPTQRAGYQPG